MIFPAWLSDKLFLKLAALFLSLILWGGVAAGRGGERKLVVPVKIVNLAPGMAIRSTMPAGIELSVVGPRLLLYRLQGENLHITLDFSGVGSGVVAFDNLGRGLDLHPGLEVIRTIPGRLQVWVEPSGEKPVLQKH